MTRIMVVEDEPVVAEDIGARIVELGYELVAVAYTGEEALRLARETPVDLVVMDIHLEGGRIDGVEAATRLRTELDVPVVFVTAFADKQTLERAVDAEPLGYLLKPFTDPEIERVIGHAVTKQRARTARDERQRWLEAAFGGLPDAVVLVDEHDRIARVNPVAESLVRSPAQALVGRPWSDAFPLVGPAEQDDGTALLERARTADAAVRSTASIHLRLPGGDEIPVELSAMAIARQGHASGSVAVVLRDAREQRRLLAESSLASRLTALGSFASGLAHEVNNPLAAAMVGLELIARETKRLHAAVDRTPPSNATDLHGNVERIETTIAPVVESLHRIESMLKDLSSFSRPGTERKPKDIRHVIESSIRLVENQLTHRARLHVDLGSTPVEVDANEAQLTRAFVNLLVNAAESIPEGEPEGNTIRVGLRPDGEDHVVVTIEDTGRGITPDRMVRMYDPFFTTKPVGSGMGLGLSVTHSVITAHEGEIHARSEPSRGTVFEVRLPSRVGHVPAKAAETAAPARRRLRILVVDDEPLIASLLRDALGEAHEVHVTSSPRDALELLRRDARFDVVLSDVVMPDLDGIALYEAVRKEHPELASRFVFMTGGAFTPRTERFLESIPGRSILKPVRIASLERLLLSVGTAGIESAP